MKNKVHIHSFVVLMNFYSFQTLITSLSAVFNEFCVKLDCCGRSVITESKAAYCCVYWYCYVFVWLIAQNIVTFIRFWMYWTRNVCMSVCRFQLKPDGTRWRTGGEVKGKLANGVGSQYSSHYLGTWCIQHYYRWCAHLGCQQSTELTPPLI